MIFGNLSGDQAGHLFWAQKAIIATSFADFVRWPIGPGTWQDLRSLNQETGYFYVAFKLMGAMTAPFSDTTTHALHTLLATYLLNLVVSLVVVYAFARLFASRWVSAVCALVTCLSLPWLARSSGHLSLTAFYALFGVLYLAFGAKDWSIRRKLLTGAVVGCLASACYYYLYLGSLLVACWIVLLALSRRLLRHRIPEFPSPMPYLVGAWPAVLAAALTFAAANTNLIRPSERFGTLQSLVYRGKADLRVFSNEALDFVRVHPESPEHRLLGLSPSTQLHGSNWTEFSVFLGLGGGLFFASAILLGIYSVGRRWDLEQVVPIGLLLFLAWALSLSTVAVHFHRLMPAVRVYSRIAIVVLPASIILVHLILPHLRGRIGRLRTVYGVSTALLLAWPAWYATRLVSALVPYRDDQTHALAYIDEATKKPAARYYCLEFAQNDRCPLEFTDGFKLFLATHLGFGIQGVTIDGARIFSDPAYGREAPQLYQPGQCLKVPAEVYAATYPGRSGC